MNKLVLLGIILSCNLAFAKCSYKSQIEYLWNKATHEREFASPEGFLPQDVKEFLITSAETMQPEEKLILAFYPTQCGFDALAEETHGFIDMQEFHYLTKELGYKIIYCAPQRHFAEFENLEELDAFMQKTFATHLNREDTPLRVPTKIIFAELQKKS